jgi:hypothetical protein
MTYPSQESKHPNGSCSWIFSIAAFFVMSIIMIEYNFENVSIKSTVSDKSVLNMRSKEKLGENWVIFLRIPRTSSTFLSETVDIISHGRYCDWDKCKCQTGSVTPQIHGKPCYQMTCIHECNQLSSRIMWRDAPHADWLEIERGLVAAKIPNDLVFMMTMLRKPIDRLTSEFNYVLGRFVKSQCNSTENSIYAWDYTVPCNYSLIDMLNDRVAALRFTNRQTRMLAGVGGFESEKFYDDDEDMLRTAKIHLRKMAWFGLTERVDDSLWMLTHQSLNLGLKLNITHSLSKRSTAYIRSPAANAMMLPHTRAKLKAMNNLDERLYAYAVNLFNKRLVSAAERKIRC